MKVKDFIIKVLNGTAIGIVVALIPNAVLSEILKRFIHISGVSTLLNSLLIMQALVSVIIGILIGFQFGFNPMKASIIGAAAFISSGVIKPVSIVIGDKPTTILKMAGVGDLINVMIFSAIAVLVTMYLGDKLGSVTIVFQPIIVGALIGFLGLIALPYVSLITKTIGSGIEYFTTLQPLLMSVLIAISFGIIIITPISTVAIGLAIGLQGLGSGAANVGIVATAAVLIIGSIYAKNKSGVTLAILLGAMKMMMPNAAKNPILYLPIIITSIISGIGVKILGVVGDPSTAGFGLVGAIGPLRAYRGFIEQNLSSPFIRLIFAYIIIPFGIALLCHIILCKILKVYSKDIFKFES